ncbi:MAG TPA: 50S ribosomal protein L11 methyltransferase [Phaeodactylibacter sp.]|nr:50S ribosomal protein L11 methyltransferase [Phaeodactylibacter sp.]
MDYFKYEFQNDNQHTQMLIALLAQQSFEAFQETETGFDAFVPVPKDSEAIEQSILDLKKRFDFSHKKIRMEYQNWNAIWESNFQPIEVGDFCGIRATFHAPLSGVQHEIIINPQMAFGTGHHETTWMMIDAMKNLDIEGKTVFDYGCGTGILAVLAAQMGAKEIDALDIELPSFENTLENARINGIENIEAIHGTLQKTKDKTYDLILANINRHVILESLPTLHKMLSKGGVLLISGILKSDEQLINDAVKASGFHLESTAQRNSWLCKQLNN